MMEERSGEERGAGWRGRGGERGMRGGCTAQNSGAQVRSRSGAGRKCSREMTERRKGER